jgi:diguanylate cyclase (GGDEF)-like protein
MGGDEFVLVLPGAGAADLDAKVEQLEEAVRAAGLKISAETRLGISVGAGFFPEDGRDAESLLATADRRMYKTKQLHKNCHAHVELLHLQAAAVTIQ